MREIKFSCLTAELGPKQSNAAGQLLCRAGSQQGVSDGISDGASGVPQHSEQPTAGKLLPDG